MSRALKNLCLIFGLLFCISCSAPKNDILDEVSSEICTELNKQNRLNELSGMDVQMVMRKVYSENINKLTSEVGLDTMDPLRQKMCRSYLAQEFQHRCQLLNGLKLSFDSAYIEDSLGRLQYETVFSVVSDIKSGEIDSKIFRYFEKAIITPEIGNLIQDIRAAFNIPGNGYYYRVVEHGGFKFFSIQIWDYKSQNPDLLYVVRFNEKEALLIDNFEVPEENHTPLTEEEIKYIVPPQPVNPQKIKKK